MILIQAPFLNLQALLDGVMVGAIFALAAYGMALVWGVMNIINVCQGEYVILGGYITFAIYKAGIHPVAGLPIAFITLFLLGYILYLSLIHI